MTLRPFISAVMILAAPAALAAVAQPNQPSSDAASASAATARGSIVNRRERVRPTLPLKPRVIEAPGAAVMMIPASFDPTQNGPFAPL